jgi:hypothetical protein
LETFNPMRTRKEALDALALAHSSPRCGAKTRKGSPCRQAATAGKRRCRMHGGAPGSGAPKGNQNRLVHGHYSAAAITARRVIRALVRDARKLV